MEKRVILLNGPSSSGKSTLARAIQAASGGAFGVASIDDFLVMSPGKQIYEEDVFGITASLCDEAKRLLAERRGVVVDHVMTSDRVFGEVVARLAGCGIWLVRVTCPLEELRRREAARGDRCTGSAEASELYLYPKAGYDLTVDAFANSAEENAARILRSLNGEK